MASPKYAKDLPAGSSNTIKNVAIVGATGQSGKYILAALLSQGKHTVTAITREASTSSIPEGVHVAKVDYSSHTSLVSALKNQDALVITMAVTAPPGTQEALILAAEDAGVQWILPNEWGADSGTEAFRKETIIGTPKKVVRDGIEARGKSSWIGIATGFWYEYSLSAGGWSYGFDFGGKKVLMYGDGRVKLPTSTWELSGMAVARVLSLPILPEDKGDDSLTLEGYRNGFVRVRSFEVSQRDMLESILRVTGDKESDWTIESVDTKKYWKENFDNLMKTGDRRKYFGPALYSRGFFPDANFAKERGVENEKLGLPKEDFDESTKRALKMVEDGYFAKLMMGAHR